MLGVIFALSLVVQDPVSVTGVVFDSLARIPLAGAEVRFTAMADPSGRTVFASRSDSTGRFEMAAMPPGRYAGAFSHVAVDSLGLERAPLMVTLRPGAQVVSLGGPSESTIRRSLCPGTRGDNAVLFGRVTGVRTGQPLLGARVLVTRTDVAIVGRSAIRQPVTEAVDVGDDGAWVICRVPVNTPLQVRAVTGADTTGAVPLRFTRTALRHVALTLGTARREVVRRGGAAGEPGAGVLAWRGPARLSGTVVNPRGVPLAGARVQVVEAEREVVTNEAGAWSIDSLPEGTQLLEVRAIGFEPMRPVVQVGERTPPLEVRMMHRTITLDEVVVRGSYEQNLEQFEQRRRSSASGFFLAPEEIRRKPPTQVMAHLLFDYRDVSVKCGVPSNCTVVMFTGRVRDCPPTRDCTREECTPSLYVDGLPQPDRDFSRFTASQVAAIEVYPSQWVPPQFAEARQTCGAVVVWTNLRAPRR